MEGAAGEILGFLPVFHYDDRMAQEVVSRFEAGIGDSFSGQDLEYAPVMLTLGHQAGMAQMLVYAQAISGMLIFLFVLAMSIVLWNAGLLGGLRRYTEFGIRIALGEDKGHIYRSLLWEALVIGGIGSVLEYRFQFLCPDAECQHANARDCATGHYASHLLHWFYSRCHFNAFGQCTGRSGYI